MMVSVGWGGEWGEPPQTGRTTEHLHKAVNPEEEEELRQLIEAFSALNDFRV